MFTRRDKKEPDVSRQEQETLGCESKSASRRQCAMEKEAEKDRESK